jgi:hypothetical protein
MKPVLKAHGSMLLKLRYDEPISNFAFNFKLRLYNVDVVELLIAAPGVDVNKPRADGATPLAAAVASGHVDVALKLCAAAAPAAAAAASDSEVETLRSGATGAAAAAPTASAAAAAASAAASNSETEALLHAAAAAGREPPNPAPQ